MPNRAKDPQAFCVTGFKQPFDPATAEPLEEFLRTHSGIPSGSVIRRKEDGAEVLVVTNLARVQAALEEKRPMLLVHPNTFLFGTNVWTLTSAELELDLTDAELAQIFRRKRSYMEDERIRLKESLLADKSQSGSHLRKPIPEKVKMFVWRRDGGRCVECGSRERLEFDHDIPVSKGGSNTERNIRLLCEACNRRKSDKI
jgi:hypothetical protein